MITSINHHCSFSIHGPTSFELAKIAANYENTSKSCILLEPTPTAPFVMATVIHAKPS